MSEIVVKSSAALQGVIQALQTLLRNFEARRDSIASEQVALTSKWKGDASTAFNQNWQKEKSNFDVLSQALNDYIRALGEILTEYEGAESKNINIANSSR